MMKFDAGSISKLSRGNQVLAVALVVQVVVMAIVFWPRPAIGQASGQALLPGLEVDQVTRVAITNNLGQRIELAREAGGWTLPAADSYPLRESAPAEFIEKLVALTADRAVTQTAGSQKQLKVAVDTFERKIELDLADGSRRVLYVGTAPTFGVIHARPEGVDAVYLVSGLTASDANILATAWVDNVYLSMPREEIYHVTIENAGGKYELAKDDAGDWALAGLAAGEEFDDTRVNTAISVLSSVRLAEPLGRTERAEYGLADPQAIVSAKTKAEDGTEKTYVLTVGAKLEDPAGYVVSCSESPWYVQVSEYTVRDFVEWTRDSLLVQPTPMPAAQ